MPAKAACRCICLLIALALSPVGLAHPLRLSLSELEYSSDQQLLTVSLRLFLMDVREALVFDPDSTELAFCQPDESEDAERLLLDYLGSFFYIKVNGKPINLQIKHKMLNGEGDNIALVVYFEHRQAPPIRSMEIRNAVFTDLFFDQNNVVYVHLDGESTSLMLNKKTPVHRLEF